MALLMIALALVIGYPIFMIFSYLLAKLIFTKIDEEEDLQHVAKKEKLVQMIKSRQIRIRKINRLPEASI